MAAFDTQVDGNHYKNKRIQPIQLAYLCFGGDTIACKIAKYLTREKDDWAKQCEKAKHCFLLSLEVPDSSVPFSGRFSPQENVILEIFVEQEPEPVREALLEIFAAYRLIRIKGETVEADFLVNTVNEHVNTILNYYKGLASDEAVS